MGDDTTNEKKIDDFIDELVVSGARTLIIERNSEEDTVISSTDPDPFSNLIYEVDDGCLMIKSEGGSSTTFITSGQNMSFTNWFGNNAAVTQSNTHGGISTSIVNGKRQVRIGSLSNTTMVVDGVDVTNVVGNYLNRERSNDEITGNIKIIPLKKLILTNGCLLGKIRCSGSSTVTLLSIETLDQYQFNLSVSGSSDVNFKFGSESYDGIADISCSGSSNVKGLIIGWSATLNASGCSDIKVFKTKNAKIRERSSGASTIKVKNKD